MVNKDTVYKDIQQIIQSESMEAMEEFWLGFDETGLYFVTEKGFDLSENTIFQKYLKEVAFNDTLYFLDSLYYEIENVLYDFLDIV